MTPEQNPERLRRRDIPLGPPAGPISGAKAIFWNEREFRAGWRLLIYLLLCLLFLLAGNFPDDGFAFSAGHARGRHGNFHARSGMRYDPRGVRGRGDHGNARRPPIRRLRPAARRRVRRALLAGRGVGNRDDRGDHLPDSRVRRIFLRRIGACEVRRLWGYAALWGVVFLCVGLFEEFLFRGYAQFTLATGIGFWPAATALSAAFGALHLANSGEDKVGALSVFVIGMFFCLTLRRTGNLWFAVGLHAAFDWGETFLFSVPDSGLVAPGHLLNSSVSRPRVAHRRHGGAGRQRHGVCGCGDRRGSVCDRISGEGMTAAVVASESCSRTGFSLSGFLRMRHQNPTG